MPPRSTYRHGDLRRALLEAGTAMAREGGPEAIILREATRRAGVAPNAAYRHFADRQALLAAVCAVAQTQVAIAIETEQSALPPATDPVEAARARLRAVGTGYLRFAQDEPELFRTAYSVPLTMADAADPDHAGPSGLTAFQLLSAALDGLAKAGVLPRERRPGAEFVFWSAVYGLATLSTQGPLRALDDAYREKVGQRVLDMIENGL